MNALVEIKIGAATLAEVLDHLERNCRLSATRRRDLISAVNGVAQLLGQHPSGIQADVPSLRAALLAVDLIRHNMKTKRFANIKADLAYALRLARVIVRARPKPQHTAAWSAFLGHADAKHQAWSLSRFVAFCVHRDIEPSDVNDAALEAFEDFLNQTIITKAPAAITKAMAQTWNGIINRKQLNFRPLTVPQSMRFLALPLTSYPDSLRVDRETFSELRRDGFAWQEGFGAFSIGVSGLEDTVEYIRTQEEHHRHRSFREDTASDKLPRQLACRSGYIFRPFAQSEQVFPRGTAQTIEGGEHP